MVVDIRLSSDFRKLIQAFPDHAFTRKDIIDILQKRTLDVFERHGKKGCESHIPSTNSSITDNKAKFLGKDTSKKSFPETPAVPESWLERLSIIKRELGLSQDSSLQDLRTELKDYTFASRAMMDESINGKYSKVLNSTVINFDDRKLDSIMNTAFHEIGHHVLYNRIDSTLIEEWKV